MKAYHLLFLLLLSACSPNTENNANTEKEEAKTNIEEKIVEKKIEIKNSLLKKFQEVELPYEITGIKDWDGYYFEYQEKKGFYAEQLTEEEISKLFGAENIPDGPTDMVGIYSSFCYFYDENHLILVGKYLSSDFIMQMTDLEGHRIGQALKVKYSDSEERTNFWYSIKLEKDKIIQKETQIQLGDELDPETRNLKILKFEENTGKREYLINSKGLQR